MQLTARQVVEVFHLTFLRAIVSKGEDKALIVLKRGSNLRFYFGSVRYSEDIDFDVVVIAKGTLKNKVERLLRSPLIVAPLKQKRIEIGEISDSKQTDTTQRWKIGLRVEGSDIMLRTKIEFSRRDSIQGAVFARVEQEVLRTYGLTPFLSTHYSTQAAIIQKIHALAGRAEPQARDVFDLNLLIARPEAAELSLSTAQKRWLVDAIDHALSISFDDFRSNVVAYLDPSQSVLYAERAAWDAMQSEVVTHLESLR